MPIHDIIDNREQQLLERILQYLPSTERARFAVGYLFLSGLKPIREPLEKLEEVRLLIGNTTNRETMEVLAEGYKRLERLEAHREEWQYQRRVETRQTMEATAANLRESIALMDQTDEDEATVRTVLRLIEEKRLKVRVYTRGRLHAKAYIFDYGTVYNVLGEPLPQHTEGVAIVGSSNLTLSGITHNTELNVVVHGNDNHRALVEWFESLWNEAEEYDVALLSEIRNSWVAAPITPYDIYMKTLYELVKDRLEGEESREILWEDDVTRELADFQKVAVRQAIQIIRDWGGCFVSDVVGLGKSFIGAGIVKHFERTQNARPLIICPRSLVEMWERYNEVYQLNARVISMGLLHENDSGENFLLEDIRFRDRDLVLIDESHNFRHTDTQRYRLLQAFTATGRKCVLLTATPRNKSASDVLSQIRLFHPDDLTDLPIDPPHLGQFFKGVENGAKRLQDALVHLLIRRTRSHILRWYGYDAQTHQPLDPARFSEYRDGQRRAYIIVAGRHQYFPQRALQTISYSIEDTYQGLYERLRDFLGRPRQNQLRPPKEALTFARYGLWHYVQAERQKQAPYGELHQAGANLRGLIRIMMFKRLESSVYAFHETLKRLKRIHGDFLKAMESGIVPAGEEAQQLLYESDTLTETELIDALRAVSGRYRLEDFHAGLLREHIEQDIRILDQMIRLVEPVTPLQDAKLQTLITILGQSPLKEGKRLIFTQYADTARYLYENLNPGNRDNTIEVIYGTNKSRERVVGRFAPKANRWFQLRTGESEITTLVATDVLAEGLNLQDCDKVINYDLHWNPVRLIQRFGRIDRIGSEYEQIFAFNFLPERGIEKQLGLKQKLTARIAEIHETIGEDAAILDPSEQLNEEAMYAIYEQKGDQLNLFEEQDEEPITLNEAEERLRLLRREEPAELERIARLPDGIRTGKFSMTRGLYAFFRAGRYQQLVLLDSEGNVVSQDLNDVLRALSCGPEEKSMPLPQGYNVALMQAKKRFDAEATHRRSQRDNTISLTLAQKYVLRELKVLFDSTKEDGLRQDITRLEQAFRTVDTAALRKELNTLRRNGIAGSALLEHLKRIYFQYGLQDATLKTKPSASEEIPRIVCSEALLF